ncbi:DUF6054 family protein [Metabacillus sp. HB246100]
MEDKEITTLFENFFFRNGSTASMTVLLDHIEGETVMKCVSTGNGEGILDIGWGAGKSFINRVRRVVEEDITMRSKRRYVCV